GRDRGPISIDDLTIGLNFSTPPSLTVAVTGSLAIGPFYAYAEGIGVTATIVDDPEGILGNRDLRLGLKAPTACALSLDVAPIVGGGMLAVYDHEYRGALALKFESIGFSALALLN